MSKVVAPPVASLTWDQVLSWRVKRQGLERRRLASQLLEVTATLCGLQAQVMSSAALTVWARVDGLDSGAVERALWEERRLVKTWAMRGTLHLLPADELPLWCAAQANLKPRYQAASFERYFGVSRAEVEAILTAIPEALDGKSLTREELADALGDVTDSKILGDAVRSSWGPILKLAAFRGTLCFAPSSGQNVRFTRPDQWLLSWQPVAPEAAIPDVARRYLATYGPATREGFGRWFGIPSAPQAERWLTSLGDEVVRVAIDGQPAWLLAADLPEIAASEPSGIVRLLPAFDQYVVTIPRDDTPAMPAAIKDRIFRPQGWLSPVLVLDGRIAGVWSYEKKGSRLAVTIESLAAITTRVRKAVEAEAERLAAFLGGQLEVIWQC